MRTQVVPAPDVVAQVVVKFLAGRRPDQLERETQPRGQRLGQFDIDTARLAALLKTVGREVLVHRHPQHTGLDDRVVVAYRRLGIGQTRQGEQPQHQQHCANPRVHTLTQRQDARAHDRYSSMATLSR